MISVPVNLIQSLIDYMHTYGQPFLTAVTPWSIVLLGVSIFGVLAAGLLYFLDDFFNNKIDEFEDSLNSRDLTRSRIAKELMIAQTKVEGIKLLNETRVKGLEDYYKKRSKLFSQYYLKGWKGGNPNFLPGTGWLNKPHNEET